MESLNNDWDYFIPIGFNCVTADQLRIYNLRKAAYPLDWTLQDLETTISLISDNFAKFIDLSLSQSNNTQVYANNDPMITNLAYPGSGIIFAHHNPLDSKSLAYLTRCVSRWTSLSQEIKGKKILFIYIKSFNDTNKPSQTWETLLESIEKKFPQNNIGLLFIEPFSVSSIDEQTIETIYDTTRIRYIKVNCLFKPGEGEYQSLMCNYSYWDEIFGRYQLIAHEQLSTCEFLDDLNNFEHIKIHE